MSAAPWGGGAVVTLLPRADNGQPRVGDWVRNGLAGVDRSDAAGAAGYESRHYAGGLEWRARWSGVSRRSSTMHNEELSGLFGPLWGEKQL